MRENMTSLGYYIFRNYDILTLLQLVQNPSHISGLSFSLQVRSLFLGSKLSQGISSLPKPYPIL